MRDYTQRFAKKQGRFVDADEEVRAAVRASVTASGSANTAGGLIFVGAAAGRVAQRRARKAIRAQSGRLAGSFPTTKSVILVLTDHRLLVLQQGEFTNRPKRVLHTYPAADLTAAFVNTGLLAHRLSLRFADRSEVALEVQRSEDTTRFVAEACRRHPVPPEEGSALA